MSNWNDADKMLPPIGLTVRVKTSDSPDAIPSEATLLRCPIRDVYLWCNGEKNEWRVPGVRFWQPLSVVASSWELELPWPPSVNHYYRHAGHRVLISREGRAYRQTVCSALRGNGPMIEGPVEMTIDAYPPDRRRRDLDNILKCLLDSMQHARVYRDDSQIKDLHCHMREPNRTGGRVVITLQPRKG